MHSREEIVADIQLNRIIKQLLNIQRHRFINETIKEANKSFKLRKILKNLILEADVEKSPHPNTGINELEELLKKIIPILEDGYKTLTSKEEQRESFRTHILAAVENSLAPIDVTDNAEKEKIEEVQINIMPDTLNAPDEEKFIDISDSDEKDNEEEEDPLEKFSIDGHDTTGRNKAFEAFKQIENQIIDAYTILDDDDDKDVFYDYLLTNIKMYFDKFEEELGTKAEEPESDSYEPEGPTDETEMVADI